MQIYDVASYHLRGLLKGFAALGLDVPPLLAAVRLDPDAIQSAEARFPEPQMLQLFLAAEQRYDGPLFALRVASSIPFGALELIDYVVAACPTIGDGIETLAHHARVCASGFSYRIAPTEPVSEVEDEPSMDIFLEHVYGVALLPRTFVEYILAAFVARFRDHCAGGFQPIVHLRGAPRGPEEMYRKVLGRVVFDAPVDRVQVPRTQWRTENPRRDPMLASLLASHARDVTARIPASDFVATFEAATADAVRRGDPSIERVAAALALTPRTLQRRLAEHDLVFRDVLETLRRELSERYLLNTRMSLAEISALLAYSEPSAFHRAFRRWTGATPAEYRVLGGVVPEGRRLPEEQTEPYADQTAETA